MKVTRPPSTILQELEVNSFFYNLSMIPVEREYQFKERSDELPRKFEG